MGHLSVSVSGYLLVFLIICFSQRSFCESAKHLIQHFVHFSQWSSEVDHPPLADEEATSEM